MTFDRKTKKDSFYLYKAWWGQEPFVHICGKRFQDRTESTIPVKVYSNQGEVTLFVNGKKQETKSGRHVFTFTVPLGDETTHVRVTSGEWSDEANFRKVARPNPAYSLKDTGDKGANWTK